jgi:hypothetical protein
VSTTTNNQAFRQAAIFGGLVAGVLSALPIIAVGNVCCCMWIVCGGLVAAYVFQQHSAVPMTAADGALAGLFAGLAGAVVYFVLSIPMDIIMGPMERAMVQRFVDMSGNMPPEMRDMFERFNGNASAAGIVFFLVRRIVGFVFMLFIGAIFSTLGGLIGSALFATKMPPGTIDVPR